MGNAMLYQLVYISTVSPKAVVDLPQILSVSQVNNGRDGITGLLFYNGKRFLQALEGEQQAVEKAIVRIRADPRHRAIVILSQRTIEHREFGRWTMADATASTESAALFQRIEALVANASPVVRATFASYARVNVAAG